jgi:hypothetical protein
MAVELNADVLSVIYHFLGEGRFPLVPGYGHDPGLGTVILKEHDNRYWHRAPIHIGVHWPTFDPQTALKPDRSYQGPDDLIKTQWVATRQVLHQMCTMAAVCRAWATVLDRHWSTIHTAVQKFFRLVSQGVLDLNARELVSRPLKTLAPLSPAWFKLAVKFACRNGRKLAKQQIHLKKPIKGKVFKPKPATLYVVRDKVTQVRRITKGKHIINPAAIELEGTLVEKKVGGRNFWRTATVDQVDAAMLRRRQILADTRAMANALRRAQRGK